MSISENEKERRRKIRLSMMGNKRGVGNKNHLGKKHSEESRKKMSLKLKGRKGVFSGKSHTAETRKRISENRKNKAMGENHFAWKGGKGAIYRNLRTMPEYKEWRSKVFERDGWKCMTCGITGVYVTAHHKKSMISIIRQYSIENRIDARKFDELWDINNGVTLCEECHSLTDNYKRRATKK